MKKTNTPKARIFGNPFVDGFTDIEKESTNLTIGESSMLDNIFHDDLPEYVKVLCTLSPQTEFGNVVISARYKEREDGEVKSMSYKLYDGSSINMTGFVSELSITAIDVLPDFGVPDGELQSCIAANNVIYTKKFQTQTASTNVNNFVDRSVEESGVIHTKSKAHHFAGSYFSGIKLSDIQPYLFYVGTSYQAKPYISIVSASDVLQVHKAELSPGITPDSLSTLEDDICNGKVEITVPNSDISYKSMASIKETVTSDVFQIIFKKEIKNG